jgi:hypothetical protein
MQNQRNGKELPGAFFSRFVIMEKGSGVKESGEKI